METKTLSVPISLVRTGDRIRAYPGDLKGLADSMQRIGLLNPILVDRDFYLIAGYRRLTAARRLGWETIEARMLDVRDKQSLLLIEIEENTARTDFTPDQLEYAQRLLARRDKTGIFWTVVNWLLG